VTQQFEIDPRNANILISVNGELMPRDKAVVSVFDSGFVLGDGVWEGLRLHNGGIAFLREHIERLYEGAKAIFMDIGLTPDELVERLFACLDANQMAEGVHVRLMVTRGVKATPYQDPRATISPATVVIIPEWKSPRPEVVAKGLKLHTVNVRRGAPDVQDQKLNSHSKLNCITACVQAMNAGADEALIDERPHRGGAARGVPVDFGLLVTHHIEPDVVDDGEGGAAQLAEDIAWNRLCRKSARDPKRQCHGRIQVRAGDVTDRINHCQHDQAERQGDAGMGHTATGCLVDHDRASPRKHERKRPDEFCEIRFHG